MRFATDGAGPPQTPHGAAVFGQSLINKDAAFTDQERAALGLRGLLPWRVAMLREQVTLELEHLRGKPSDMEKYRACPAYLAAADFGP